MAATSRDAQEGWEIFRESGYALSFSDLNKALKRAGFRPISARMFQHYHKLVRYGYEEYLPINQLDVRTLQNPVWDAATRNRYTLREISMEAELRFLHRGEFLVLRGLATRISDASVVVRLEGAIAEEVAATKIRAGDQRVDIVFLGTGEVLRGSIESIYARPKEELAVFRIVLTDRGSLEALDLRRPLSVRRLRVEVHDPRDAVYLADVVQSFYWLFQGVEAARAVTDELLIGLDLNQEFAIPAARVDRVRMESPLQVELLLGAPVIFLVLSVVRQMVKIRNDYLQGNVLKEEAGEKNTASRKLTAEARAAEALADRLERENAEAERLGLDDPLIAQTIHLIRNLLAEEGAPSRKRLEVPEKVVNVLNAQVRPALTSLLEAAGDAEISVEADPDVEAQVVDLQKDS